MESQNPEPGLKFYVYVSLLLIIFFIMSIGLVSLSGCQYIPDIAQNVDDIATDTAIKVEISKEALKKGTDLDINVQVDNKKEEQK